LRSVETHDGDGVPRRCATRMAKTHVQRAVAAAGLKPVSLASASTRTKRRSRSRADQKQHTETMEPARDSSALRTRCRTSLRAGSQAGAGSRARISSTYWRKRGQGGPRC
jgi:hypothetical protein